MRDKLLKREKFQKKFDPRQNFEGSSGNLSLALLNLNVDPIFFRAMLFDLDTSQTWAWACPASGSNNLG